MGSTGTGKSVYVKDKLMNGLDKDVYQPLVVNYSAQTRAGLTQVGFLSPLISWFENSGENSNLDPTCWAT